MCNGSEAGSHLRLIDFVYYSTLGLKAIKREEKTQLESDNEEETAGGEEKEAQELR